MINKKIRENVFNKFAKLFGNEIASKIEDSIYHFSNDYAENNNTPFLLESIYNSKADEIYCMLVGKNNENLEIAIKSFKNNKIDPSKISTMKPSELNLLLSNKQYLDIIKKREFEMMIKDTKASSAFECKKCKKRKCSITEKQVRAADEPATQFITCLECGHVFTIN